MAVESQVGGNGDDAVEELRSLQRDGGDADSTQLRSCVQRCVMRCPRWLLCPLAARAANWLSLLLTRAAPVPLVAPVIALQDDAACVQSAADILSCIIVAITRCVAAGANQRRGGPIVAPPSPVKHLDYAEERSSVALTGAEGEALLASTIASAAAAMSGLLLTAPDVDGVDLLPSIVDGVTSILALHAAVVEARIISVSASNIGGLNVWPLSPEDSATLSVLSARDLFVLMWLTLGRLLYAPKTADPGMAAKGDTKPESESYLTRAVADVEVRATAAARVVVAVLTHASELGQASSQPFGARDGAWFMPTDPLSRGGDSGMGGDGDRRSPPDDTPPPPVLVVTRGKLPCLAAVGPWPVLLAGCLVPLMASLRRAATASASTAHLTALSTADSLATLAEDPSQPPSPLESRVWLQTWQTLFEVVGAPLAAAEMLADKILVPATSADEPDVLGPCSAMVLQLCWCWMRPAGPLGDAAATVASVACFATAVVDRLLMEPAHHHTNASTDRPLTWLAPWISPVVTELQLVATELLPTLLSDAAAPSWMVDAIVALEDRMRWAAARLHVSPHQVAVVSTPPVVWCDFIASIMMGTGAVSSVVRPWPQGATLVEVAAAVHLVMPVDAAATATKKTESVAPSERVPSNCRDEDVMAAQRWQRKQLRWSRAMFDDVCDGPHHADVADGVVTGWATSSSSASSEDGDVPPSDPCRRAARLIADGMFECTLVRAVTQDVPRRIIELVSPIRGSQGCDLRTAVGISHTDPQPSAERGRGQLVSALSVMESRRRAAAAATGRSPRDAYIMRHQRRPADDSASGGQLAATPSSVTGAPSNSTTPSDFDEQTDSSHGDV